MQKLPNSINTIEGIAKEVSKFSCVEYLDDIQLSDGLIDGTIKSAAVIACSEMGWLVPYVCSSETAQLHLFQNFGHNFDTGGLTETLIDSRIEKLIVYGHSDCEYKKFSLKSKSKKQLSANQGGCKEDGHLTEMYSQALESNDQELWSRIGQYDVLNEIKKMMMNPLIASLAKQNILSLHGWFYIATTRQLEVFDPQKEKFTMPGSELNGSQVMKFTPDKSHVREE